MSGPEVPATPDAAFLSAVLRDPSRWPDGFQWDFRNSDCCAIGLARSLWPNIEQTKYYPNSPDMAGAFGIPESVACLVFMSICDKGVDRHRDVTPSLVADALDRAIATQVSA